MRYNHKNVGVLYQVTLLFSVAHFVPPALSANIRVKRAIEEQFSNGHVMDPDVHDFMTSFDDIWPAEQFLENHLEAITDAERQMPGVGHPRNYANRPVHTLIVGDPADIRDSIVNGQLMPNTGNIYRSDTRFPQFTIRRDVDGDIRIDDHGTREFYAGVDQNRHPVHLETNQRIINGNAGGGRGNRGGGRGNRGGGRGNRRRGGAP